MCVIISRKNTVQQLLQSSLVYKYRCPCTKRLNMAPDEATTKNKREFYFSILEMLS